MSAKNKKQYGIWMDTHTAIIIGRKDLQTGDFIVLANEQNDSQGSNSNENASNNAERSLQLKYFKRISAHMQNAEELHVTGTGQVQEQFVRFMADTPQFKNTVALQSTSSKMGDAKLIEYITSKFSTQ